MKSTEDKKIRLDMVDMHQFFLNKIDDSINNERYIEASWLIYSCMENRFFRTIKKFNDGCKCSNKYKNNKNFLSLSTKIQCIRRLCENDVECISKSFTLSQLDKIKNWTKKRNDLMHNLLTLDKYKDTDIDFKNIAIEGRIILENLYASCTEFRRIFYSDNYKFCFPDEAKKNCYCNRNQKNKNEKTDSKNK